jgi:hypothetical protein
LPMLWRQIVIGANQGGYLPAMFDLPEQPHAPF